MRIFHYMCSNTWRDKVRNKNIHAKVDITHIAEKMQENCL